MTLIYLVAGEASGDALGARLLPALRARRPELRFAGIGGERLAEQGLASLFDIGELALVGLFEVVPKLRRVAQLIDATVADIAAKRPALVLTIDSPGFTMRVAAKVKALGIPLVHYAAPQAWGWRPWRARETARLVELLLCLLPFEPAFFAARGARAVFVGHPVLESGADQGDAARFRARHGLAPDAQVVLVMPGSRRSEVRRMLPVMGAALRRVAATHPRLVPVVVLAGPVEAQVRAALADWSPMPVLVRGLAEKHDAFAAASAGLIKSGTSSLEVAVAGVPMVVGYKLNWLTLAIGRYFALVKYASIVNLLVDAPVIPELLQEFCTPDSLAAALTQLLDDPAVAAAQRAGCAQALAMLRPAGGVPPSAAAAAAVLGVLARIEAAGAPAGSLPQT